MTDTLTPSARSNMMSRIRSVGTLPERRVEKALETLGIVYQTHAKDLPGTPDLVLHEPQTAIFVNGCFWHQHRGCPRCTMPKTRTSYWAPKLDRNIKRGRHISRRLRSLGWRVLVVWECQTKDPDRLSKLLARRISASNG